MRRMKLRREVRAGERKERRPDVKERKTTTWGKEAKKKKKKIKKERKNKKRTLSNRLTGQWVHKSI